MPILDPSLPPQAQTSEYLWSIYLSQTPVSSVDLNGWRFGTQATHHRYPVRGIQRAIPIPHPGHKDYPSIMTARNNRTRSEEWWARKKVELHHERINHQTWIKPMHESAFQIFRPNIRNFHRVLNLELPEGMI